MDTMLHSRILRAKEGAHQVKGGCSSLVGREGWNSRLNFDGQGPVPTLVAPGVSDGRVPGAVVAWCFGGEVAVRRIPAPNFKVPRVVLQARREREAYVMARVASSCHPYLLLATSKKDLPSWRTWKMLACLIVACFCPLPRRRDWPPPR